jgi:hypothetical protein
VLLELFARADFELDPPDFCLLNNKDFRREPLVLDQVPLFKMPLVSIVCLLESLVPKH